MATISTIMRGQKSLDVSFGDFYFMTTNNVAAIHLKDKATEEYHPIMDFLTQGPLDYTLVHEPVLSVLLLVKHGHWHMLRKVILLFFW